MNYGEFRWDDAGVPAGAAWVRVDLSTQLISVFRAGHEIGTAVILYGGDGVATPTGNFPILAKMKDHRSSTYDAPMPYTLRLTGDGVSIHGSNVRWGFATHGCVGVPTAFAAKLFDVLKKGDEVAIVDGTPRKAATS
jgi:lipoprotein-anchoring transpeptidase ErfK/SrfK